MSVSGLPSCVRNFVKVIYISSLQKETQSLAGQLQKRVGAMLHSVPYEWRLVNCLPRQAWHFHHIHQPSQLKWAETSYIFNFSTNTSSAIFPNLLTIRVPPIFTCSKDFFLPTVGCFKRIILESVSALMFCQVQLFNVFNVFNRAWVLLLYHTLQVSVELPVGIGGCPSKKHNKRVTPVVWICPPALWTPNN